MRIKNLKILNLIPIKLSTFVYYISLIIFFYGLWCLTPPSTIFQLYRGGQFSLCTNWPGKKCLDSCIYNSETESESDDSCHLYSSIVPSIHFVPFNVSNSKRNWAKFGVGVKLIVILRHIIAYFSINIRWHSQNV
jgi:L-2-hydroxyglutarate oxidase LhgO